MIIKVKVISGAGTEEVVKEDDESFEVKVKARARKGEANRAVKRALAKHFGFEEPQIRLIKGFKQRNKIFKIAQT
jgi:hypothetical protein